MKTIMCVKYLIDLVKTGTCTKYMLANLMTKKKYLQKKKKKGHD